jgi:uncharacterized protein
MSATAAMSPTLQSKRGIAPWWHTALVLLVMLACSAVSAHQHSLEHVNLPGLSTRLSSYLTVMAEEWLVVAFIWHGLKRCGISIDDLISGRWQSFWAFLRDFGLAIGLIVLEVALIGIAFWAFGVSAGQADMNDIPKTGIEAGLYMACALTAGFCEEVIFRGYLSKQFAFWTGSNVAAMLIQGVAFGLCHGYKGARSMVLVMVYGWLWGALAYWRKSLRPGIIAHCVQDTGIGLLAFLYMK